MTYYQYMGVNVTREQYEQFMEYEKGGSEMKLNDLAVNHPYYANEYNWFDGQMTQEYKTFTHFYDEWNDADVDLNYCYRFDIYKDDECEEYSMNIVLILQRKGIYKPILIESVTESEVPKVLEYLKKHYEKTRKLWEPFS